MKLQDIAKLCEESQVKRICIQNEKVKDLVEQTRKLAKVVIACKDIIDTIDKDLKENYDREGGWQSYLLHVLPTGQARKALKDLEK